MALGNKVPLRTLSSDTSLLSSTSIGDILSSVKNGSMSSQDAERMLLLIREKTKVTPEETLQSFANLDHTRPGRTGFPEVVFAETKTPKQVTMILDDMARHVNDMIEQGNEKILSLPGSTAILATRVTPEMYDEISKMEMVNGTISYHEKARIVSMRASALSNLPAGSVIGSVEDHVVVATAGTTDLPVAEEAAVVLEAAGCKVDRIFDVGVAGLHRVVNAVPRLRDDKVGAIIVCAGMDGGEYFNVTRTKLAQNFSMHF